MILGVPLATYRLQFNADFRFEDVIQIRDYLRELGISHIYASPVLTSRRGSGHRYNVTDPTKIDAELCGDEGYSALRAALEVRGMGLLLDIVPNHMAACSENRWWMDVLEYGSDSPYASYFDINWRPPTRSMENKILLPFLDRPFGEALDAGEFRVEYEEGRLLLRHGDQIFPLAPASYADILGSGEGKPPIEPDSSAAHEWGGILAAARAVAADGDLSNG
jgi:(1->4)-alpha-D-glucan 1-alpha-D-glucosylmutase